MDRYMRLLYIFEHICIVLPLKKVNVLFCNVLWMFKGIHWDFSSYAEMNNSLQGFIGISALMLKALQHLCWNEQFITGIHCDFNTYVFLWVWLVFLWVALVIFGGGTCAFLRCDFSLLSALWFILHFTLYTLSPPLCQAPDLWRSW